MNTPKLITERLILRQFTQDDIEAAYQIFSDTEVNTFLPWFPLKNIEETREFLYERYLAVYDKPYGYAYAVCLKEDNIPIGYVNIKTDISHDLGYGLRKEFWHKGITNEACRAIMQQAKSDGQEYITATHDVKNPRSGSVMKRLGMEYKYSYEEIVQPKNERVIFRLYQIKFVESAADFYGYSDKTFIEKD